MESFELTVLIISLCLVLVVLLVILLLIKIKCCRGELFSNHQQSTNSSPRFSTSPRPERRTPAFPNTTDDYFPVRTPSGHNRDARDEFNSRFPFPVSAHRGQQQSGAPGLRRPTYAEATGYRIESERPSRPSPYTVHTRGNAEGRLGPRNSQRIPLPVPTTHRSSQTNQRNKEVDEIILALQGSLRDDSNASDTVAEVQNLLALNLDSAGLISEDCRLIIGVDATPATQAGYCVNLKLKRLYYYVVKRGDLPWVLHDPKDPSEFEMKNFMFALTVWEQEILKFKRMRIYTDNFAITKAKCFDDNKYGERATQVLRHYSTCKDVTVLNMQSMAVNRFKNLKNFAQFIQPADDLSRWRINEAVKFLTKFYGIDQENVFGTHNLHVNHNRQTTGKPWYKPTERYQEILQYTNRIITCHDCPNSSCLGSDVLQASLRIKK